MMWKKILVILTVLVCYLAPISIYAAPQTKNYYTVKDWRNLDQRNKELTAMMIYASYWTGVRDAIHMFCEKELQENFETMRKMLILATPISSKDFAAKVDEVSAKAAETDDMMFYFYKVIEIYLNKSADKLFEKPSLKEPPHGSGPKRTI